MNLLRADRSTLSIDQWNLLSNLSHCYDDHAGLSVGEQYMSKQNSLPCKLRFKSPSLVHLFQVVPDAAQSLYRNNRDFLSLSVADRSTLLNGTLLYTAGMSSNFIFHKIRLTEHVAFYDAVEMMTSATTASIGKRLSSRLYFDVFIMKLFLTILSFSTIRCTAFLNNTSDNLPNIKKILHIQDGYIELTWRYLLYKYDHEQAVKCFSDFIRCIFIVNEGLVEVQKVQWFTDTMDSVTEKTEQSLILSE